MMKLCDYTSGFPFAGVKYLPNNESRAIAVRTDYGVCMLEVSRYNLTKIGTCLSLGVSL